MKEKLQQAERKATEALARGEFHRFSHWASKYAEVAESEGLDPQGPFKGVKLMAGLHLEKF